MAYLFYFYAILPIYIAVGFTTRGVQTMVSSLSPTWLGRYLQRLEQQKDLVSFLVTSTNEA